MATRKFVALTKSSHLRWRVSKRYNQLLAFHKWVVRNHMVDTKLIPPFPEAPILDKVLREYEEVAEERKFMIESYLEYLINGCQLTTSVHLPFLSGRSL